MTQVWGKQFNKSAAKACERHLNRRTSSWQSLSIKLKQKVLDADDDIDLRTLTIRKLKQKSASDGAFPGSAEKDKGEEAVNVDKGVDSRSSADTSASAGGIDGSVEETASPTVELGNIGVDNQPNLFAMDRFRDSDEAVPIRSFKRKSDVFEFDEIMTPKKRNFGIIKSVNDQNSGLNETPFAEENEETEEIGPSETKQLKFFKSRTEKRTIKMKENFFNEELVGDKVESKRTEGKVSRPKKKQENFRKLNMKKKVFASRGYKKFNIRKYKRTKWKQMKKSQDNSCYRCGKSGHWAVDCTFEDDPEDEGFDVDLEKAGISNSLEDIKSNLNVKPIIKDDNLQADELIFVGLNEMGLKSFRKNQEETIRRILRGKSVILVSSTGSGKSLCYQLPALLYWKSRRAVTLVVSPLISLMEDQLSTFPKCLKAVSIHSGLSLAQKQSAISMILNGEAQVLLISPEAVVGGSTLINFNALPPIAFVCIDEAHCLSEWSNNFRPSYLQLYRVLKEKLKINTFLALTATATRTTSKNIARTLDLNYKEDVIGTTTVPDNLCLTVSRDSNKDSALIDLLRSQFFDLNSIIVYCTRREETERLASLIRISMQDVRVDDKKTGKSRLAWDAQAYHAGLPSDQRARVQKKFLNRSLRVVVATIAFGMGINKSDVRGIIHYNMPKSFENYMQEIGRAGRDGLEARCHLFLDSDGGDLFELQRHIYASSTDKRTLRKLLERVFRPCKCRVLSESDNPVINDRICVGHEVAFPIEQTVLELDMRDETILTLLTYLESNLKKININLLSHINSMCTVFCYGDGSNQMEDIAKKCHPIGIALAMYKKRLHTEETPSKFKFSVVETASMLGKPTSEVKKQLRELEWFTENGRPKRTNVRVVFSDLSFFLKAPGDLTPDELDETLEDLNKYVIQQETTEINKLKLVYYTFKILSQKRCTKKINLEKSMRLKMFLNHFFNEGDLSTEQLQAKEEQQIKLINDKLKLNNVFDLEQTRRDVRDFLAIHGHENFNARSIARILQGIASPKYPAEVWGKIRRFWRSNVRVDFNELMKIANEELIRLKG